MILDLRDIFSGDRNRIDIHGTLPLPLEGEDAVCLDGVTFPEGAHLDGRVTNDAGYIRLKLEVSCPYIAACARCLKEIRGVFTFSYERTVAAKGTLENADAEESDEYLVAENARLDIGSRLREELEMQFPYRLLCREDCRGLCPKCGKDLNEGDCSCDFSEPDPRFAVLQQLLEHKDSEK